MFQLHVHVENAFRRWLSVYGVRVCRQPLRIVLVCIFFSVVMSGGCLRLNFDEGFGMWYPHQSTAYKDMKYRERVFGTDNITVLAVAVAREPPRNILSPQVLREVSFVRKSLRIMEATDKNVFQITIT
eukprot:m.166680 g.166680  ORF g.166680 m.166680 type:complete len:128 (+) comp15290_c0_seq4:193-576(+)